jgi:hypothetical protein
MTRLRLGLAVVASIQRAAESRCSRKHKGHKEEGPGLLGPGPFPWAYLRLLILLLLVLLLWLAFLFLQYSLILHFYERDQLSIA